MVRVRLSQLLARLARPTPVRAPHAVRRGDMELQASLDMAVSSADLLTLLEATADDEAGLVVASRGAAAALLLQRLDAKTTYVAPEGLRGARRKRAAIADAELMRAERRALQRDERYRWLVATVGDTQCHAQWSTDAFLDVMLSVHAIGGGAVPAALEGMAGDVPRRLEPQIADDGATSAALTTPQLSIVARLLTEMCPTADATRLALEGAARSVAQRGVGDASTGAVASLAWSLARSGVAHAPFAATIARDVVQRAASFKLRSAPTAALAQIAWALGRFVDAGAGGAVEGEQRGGGALDALVALANEVAARGRSGCLDGRDFGAAAVHRTASGLSAVVRATRAEAREGVVDATSDERLRAVVSALRVLAGEIEAMSHAPNRAGELVATLSLGELEELTVAFDVARVRTPGAHAASAAWWRAVQQQEGGGSVGRGGGGAAVVVGGSSS